ncbi:SET domain [Trinorchestia longiramus]|nr:SET domain [Trinorchestia longiramus]
MVDEKMSAPSQPAGSQFDMEAHVPSTASTSTTFTRVQVSSANSMNNFCTSALGLSVPNASHAASADVLHVTCSHPTPACQSSAVPAVNSSSSVTLPLFSTGNPSQIHSLFYEAPCVSVSERISQHQNSVDPHEYSALFTNNSQVAQQLKSDIHQPSPGPSRLVSSMFKSSNMAHDSNINQQDQTLGQHSRAASKALSSPGSSSLHSFPHAWSPSRPLAGASSQNIIQTVAITKVSENSVVLKNIPFYSTVQSFQDNKVQTLNQRQILPLVSQPCLEKSDVQHISMMSKYSASNVSLPSQMGENSSTSSSTLSIPNQNSPSLINIVAEQHASAKPSGCTLNEYMGSHSSINCASTSAQVCPNLLQSAEVVNMSSGMSIATSSSVLHSVAGQSHSVPGPSFGCTNSSFQAPASALAIGFSGDPVPGRSNEFESLAEPSSAMEISNSSGSLSVLGTSDFSSRSSASRASNSVRLPSMSRLSSVASSSQHPGSFNCSIASTSRDIFGMDVHAYSNNDLESNEAYPVILVEPPARNIACEGLPERSLSPGEECCVSSSTEHGGEEGNGRGSLHSHPTPSLPLLDSTVDSTGDPTPLDCLDTSDREFSRSPALINSPYSYEADSGLIQSSQYESSSSIAMNSLKNIYLTSFPAKSHDFYSSSDEEDEPLGNFSVSRSYIPSLSASKSSTQTNIHYLYGQRKSSLQATNPGKSIADQVDEAESPGVACSEDSIGEIASSYELGLSGSLPHSGRDPLARGGSLLQLPDQILEHQQHLTLTAKDVPSGLDGDCEGSCTADNHELEAAEPRPSVSGYRPKAPSERLDGCQEAPVEGLSVTTAGAAPARVAAGDTGASAGADTVASAGADTGASAGADTGACAGADTGAIAGADTGADTGACAGAVAGSPAAVVGRAATHNSGHNPPVEETSSSDCHAPVVRDREAAPSALHENNSSSAARSCAAISLLNFSTESSGSPSSLSQTISPSNVNSFETSSQNDMLAAAPSFKKSLLPSAPVAKSSPVKVVEVKNKEVFCDASMIDLSQLEEHFPSPVKFLGSDQNRSVTYSNSSNASGVSAAFEEIFSEEINNSSSYREKDALNHLDRSSASALGGSTQMSYPNLSESESGKSAAGPELSEPLHSSLRIPNNDHAARRHFVALSRDDLLLQSPCPTLQTQARQVQAIPVSLSHVKSYSQMMPQFSVGHHIRDPNLSEAGVQEIPVSVTAEECKNTPPPVASHEVVFESSNYLESHEHHNMNLVSETLPINSGGLSLDLVGVNVQALQTVETDSVNLPCSDSLVSSDFTLQNSVSSAKTASEVATLKSNSLFSTSIDPISPLTSPVSFSIDNGSCSSSPSVVVAGDVATASVSGAPRAAKVVLLSGGSTATATQPTTSKPVDPPACSVAVSAACGVASHHKGSKNDAKYLVSINRQEDSSSFCNAAGDLCGKIKAEKHSCYAKAELEKDASLEDSHSQQNQERCSEEMARAIPASVSNLDSGVNENMDNGFPSNASVGANVLISKGHTATKRTLFSESKDDIKMAAPAVKRPRRSRSRASKRGARCSGCEDSSGCVTYNTEGAVPELLSICDRVVRSYACQSLPASHLSIRRLNSSQGRYGVFSRARLMRYTIFGPMKGVPRDLPPANQVLSRDLPPANQVLSRDQPPTNEVLPKIKGQDPGQPCSTAAGRKFARGRGTGKAHQGDRPLAELEPLLWPYTDTEGNLKYLDTSDAEHSNWMRYVAAATEVRQVNCHAVEREDGQLYFLATRDILAGSELRVA